MDYLFIEIAFFLLIALLLGIIIGWVLRDLVKIGKLDKTENINHGLTSNVSQEGLIKQNPKARMAAETEMFEATHGKTNENLNISYDISVIEGIGKTYCKRLKELKIDTTTNLLERCGLNVKARSETAAYVKVIPKVMTSWVGMADLLRINGVDGQYAELMNEVGIANAAQLAQANGENLYRRMKRLNDAHSISPRLPEKTSLNQWISEAANLSERVKLV